MHTCLFPYPPPHTHTQQETKHSREQHCLACTEPHTDATAATHPCLPPTRSQCSRRSTLLLEADFSTSSTFAWALYVSGSIHHKSPEQAQAKIDRKMENGGSWSTWQQAACSSEKYTKAYAAACSSCLGVTHLRKGSGSARTIRPSPSTESCRREGRSHTEHNSQRHVLPLFLP